MPPIRLAGCRETHAWTYAKTTLRRFYQRVIFKIVREVQWGSIPHRATFIVGTSRIIACESNNPAHLRRSVFCLRCQVLLAPDFKRVYAT